MQLSINFVVGALAAASAVSANVFRVVPRDAAPMPAPQQHHKRSPAHGFVRRQTGQTEQSVAKLHGGMAKECVQPQAADLNGLEQKLPAEWQIASIMKGDQQANQVWGDIKNSGIVPDIQPKKAQDQQHSGIDQSFTQSYDKSDPDCWWSFNKCTQPKHKGIPADLTTCSEPNTWGLSFDDGPNCTHNEFYDFLQQNKLRASLMYIGSNVKLHPFHAQRGIADGHDICVHTWSHKYTSTMSNEQVFAELFYTIKVIKAVVGVTPRCWRPPFGDVDDRVRAIAAGLGLRTIVWQEDTDDWETLEKGTQKINQNYQNILDKAKQESPMVLTHEINSNSMNEFMSMYPKIKAAFKNIVPLTACVGATSPYPEKVTYPNFKDFTSGKIDAQGLPDPNQQKINGNPQFTPTPLSKQGSGSYMQPSQKGGSGGSKDAAAAGPASFGAVAVGVVASLIAFVAI